MDLPFLLGVGAVLGVFFLLMSAWQRRVDKAEREKALREIKETQRHGGHKAVAQYPQIKPYVCIGCSSCVAACPEDGVLGLVNGIAHVLNAAKCIGHARCEQVCPVDAITVGLGDLKSRPDIPVLSKELESSVPGIFIAGELGGMALIRHAIDQGVKALDAIATRIQRTPIPSTPDTLDVLIVGAGPAGLSASLRAHERKLRFVTISSDDVGGTIRKYPRGKLTLVQHVEIPSHGRLAGGEYTKEHLVQLCETLANKNHLNVRTGVEFKTVTRQGHAFLVQTSAGDFRTRFVILAIGRRGVPRRLGVPGEQQEHVLYQLMDTASFKNKKVLVIGGGDSAVEAAMGLANQLGNQVVMSYRRPSFHRLKSRNEKRLQEYITQKKLRVLYSSDVLSIEKQSATLRWDHSGRTETLRVPADYVFIFAGGDPPYPLLQQAGIRFGADASAA